MDPTSNGHMASFHLHPPAATVVLVGTHPPWRLAPHPPHLPSSAAVLAMHGAAYAGWSALCVGMNGGHWPYPFQAQLSVVGHALFDVDMLGAGIGAVSATHGGVFHRLRRWEGGRLLEGPKGR